MDVNIWSAAYVALGLCAGLLAGLLGIGGGTIIVPLLTMLFTAQGFPEAHVMHLALGTSMAIIIFTAVASARSHHKREAVLWGVVRDITPGILVGTAIGTKVVSHVSTRELAIVFTVLIALIALQMLIDKKPNASRTLPGRPGTAGVGVGIGFVSALIAIGGGSLTVPFLTMCNVRVQTAIGTSAAVGLPIAIGGTVGYVMNGLHANGLPPASFGYVYGPALVPVVLGSIAAAPFGAKLAHSLPVAVLKRIFAGVLLLLSAKMLSEVLH